MLGTVRGALISWVCVGLVTLAHGALAQPASAPASPPAPGAVSIREPAIGAVSAEIARALGSLGDSMVVAAPLTSDARAPRGAELARSVAKQVAGRIGPGAAAAAELADLTGARTLGRSRSRFVHLAVEIARGQLRVTADVYPVPDTVWARARAPEPGPTHHAFAQAPIDAEVRTFLEPIPLSAKLVVDRAQNFESGVLALACDDVDEDGAPEVLSVSRARVSLLRLAGGKVQPILSRPWSELSDVHPTPLREPIGFAKIVRPAHATTPGRAELVASSTDRAKSVRLDASLALIDELDGMAIPDGDGVKCAGLIALAVTGPVRRCSPGDPPPLTPTVGGRYDAFGSARLSTVGGKSFVVWAGREDRMLELRDSGGGVLRGGAVGAQLAVGDLDQDGRPEIISGLDTLDPIRDAVLVQTAIAGAQRFEEAARLPAGAGVRAVAVCPPDGVGRSAFVVATSDEVWVVR